MVPAHAMSIQLRCVTQGALASFSLQYIDRQAQPKLKTKRGGRGGRPPQKLFSHRRPWFLLCLIRATLAVRSNVNPGPEKGQRGWVSFSTLFLTRGVNEHPSCSHWVFFMNIQYMVLFDPRVVPRFIFCLWACLH
jgi:hypothetical protein